jgi:hypothetical protein
MIWEFTSDGDGSENGYYTTSNREYEAYVGSAGRAGAIWRLGPKDKKALGANLTAEGVAPDLATGRNVCEAILILLDAEGDDHALG